MEDKSADTRSAVLAMPVTRCPADTKTAVRHMRITVDFFISHAYTVIG